MAVALTALSACDGTKLHNVGDTPGATAGSESGGDTGSRTDGGSGGRRNGGAGDSGGADDIGGVGGRFDFGGAAGAGGAFLPGDAGSGGAGGGNFGGAGGGDFGGGNFGGGNFGGAGGNAPADCFAPFEVYNSETPPDLGPQNTVLLDAHIAQDIVKNAANQVVFPGFGGVWETYANFPATTPEIAAKTDLSLPAELATVPDELGQLYVTRRTCAGRVVAGHQLKVEVWWKSAATFANMPTHGVALGIVGDNDTTTWLGDATKAFVVGGASTGADIDTLNRIILQHTFAGNDTTDARKIVLGMWLLDSKIFPSNFYIGNAEWE